MGFTAAAAQVAGTSDRLLSDRVYSSRLGKGPPAWDLKRHNRRYPAFRRSAIDLLESGVCSAMRVEDVKSFFRSIVIDYLEEALASWGCDRKAAKAIIEQLRRWESEHGVVGLPIGPDASRLLANAFLLPMDLAIERAGVEHRRWMDDTLVLARVLAECTIAVEAAAEALSKIGLAFSDEKSLAFGDAQSAIAHINDVFLASLARLVDAVEALGLLEIYETLDAYASGESEINPKHLRWMLRTLGNKGDRFAVPLLLDRPELANTDPRLTGDYLGLTGVRPGREADDALALLDGCSGDRSDALALNLLRVLSRGTWGEAEGRLFRGIAMDEARRGPVRAWSLKAVARTPAWRSAEARDQAECSGGTIVPRAALGTMRGRGSADRRRFLRHLRERRPELKFTADWVDAA